MKLIGAVLCMSLSVTAVAPYAQTSPEPARKKLVEVTNSGKTAGGATTVMATPPKDPLKLAPRLIMRLREAKKTPAGQYVIALGYFAWQDGPDIIINVQTFSSSDALPPAAPMAEIVRLPRAVLLTTKLGSAGYRLKEIEAFGFADFTARLAADSRGEVPHDWSRP